MEKQKYKKCIAFLLAFVLFFEAVTQPIQQNPLAPVSIQGATTPAGTIQQEASEEAEPEP